MKLINRHTTKCFKRWGTLILLIISLLSGHFVQSVSANMYEQNVTTTPPSHLTAWDQMLEVIDQLERYQIRIRIVNLDQSEEVASGKIIGDRETGDLRVQFNVHPTEAEEHGFQYDLISYRNFDIAFSNLFEVLESTRFFDATYYQSSKYELLSNYLNHYVEVDTETFSKRNMAQDTLTSFLFLPERETLQNLTEEQIYEIHSAYQVALERTEIPNNWQRFDDYMYLKHEFHLDVNESLNPYKSYDASLTNRLNISTNNNQLQLSLDYSTRVTRDLLNLSRIYSPNDYQMNRELNTQEVTGRLTAVKIRYNPASPYYEIELHGLKDDYQFNIFNQSTADYVAERYMWQFTLLPTEEEIPSLHQLNRLSEAEFNYLIASILPIKERE